MNNIIFKKGKIGLINNSEEKDYDCTVFCIL